MDESFWDTHGNEIEALVTIVGAIVIAFVIDRFLIGRAVRAAEGMETAQISREARTRLSVIRRLISLAIILIGVALALSQFTEIKRLATGLLASTAVLGLILGFAGRTVIANFVAGVTMAIRQPIRIGDLISIGEDVHGRVIDIALTSTIVDKGDGSLLVVPNEKVVTEVVVNHSAGYHRAPVTVVVWLEPRRGPPGRSERARANRRDVGSRRRAGARGLPARAQGLGRLGPRPRVARGRDPRARADRPA